MTSILHARCVLVTGATSGIGRALALAIHNLDSKPTVIALGRRQDRLDELASLSDRIKPYKFDIAGGREAIKDFAADVIAQYPELDAVLLSAGIQHRFNFKQPEKVDMDRVEAEVNTNYLSVVTLIKFMLPHFLQLSDKGLPSFIIPVTSGLAISPFSAVPDYCATKAALHFFSLSLYAQLKETNIHVMEIFPPLTESELHDHQGATPRLSKLWMPLDVFTKECMEKLCRGDAQIPIGDTAQKWERWEKGKLEEVASTTVPSTYVPQTQSKY